MQSRPVLLGGLIANQKGQDLVLALFCSSKLQSHYESDLIGLCLREMVAAGHVNELLQVS